MKMTELTFWGIVSFIGFLIGALIGGISGYPIIGMLSGAIAVPLFIFAYCEYLLRKK